MTAFIVMLLTGCSHGKGETFAVGDTVADSVTTPQRGDDNEWVFGASDELPADINRADTVTTNDIPDEAPTSVKPQPVRTEKLYVSTFGANGQVWGYVTLHGNSGSGTIHDADENTLSITVTRNGNELNGVDQNGRRYVFKLD